MLQPLPPLASSQSLTLLGGQNGARHEKNNGESGIKAPSASTKPVSAFITQLLATKHAAEAYRQKRRCSPYEAQLAYIAGSGLVHQEPSPVRINFAI
jgi:hypothetical protein